MRTARAPLTPCGGEENVERVSNLLLKPHNSFKMNTTGIISSSNMIIIDNGS
jgi:hypothetical protein